MPVALSDRKALLQQSIQEFQDVLPLYRDQKLERLLGQMDGLMRVSEGLDLIYAEIPKLIEAGIFQQTAWEHPAQLVPGLVKGTLLSGHPNSTLEILSELRMLALVKGDLKRKGFSPGDARAFLENTLVKSVDLAFGEFTHSFWSIYSQGELKKIQLLSQKLLQELPLQGMRKKFEEQVEVMLHHRAIFPRRLEKMLRVADEHLELSAVNEGDTVLRERVNSFLHPTRLATESKTPDVYADALPRLRQRSLEKECQNMAGQMAEDGLVSPFHLPLLRYIAREHPHLVPEVLSLDAHGRAEYERHESFVRMLIQEFLVPATRYAIYGLHRVLQRSLFSRQITWNALNRLLRIQIHPQVAETLEKSNPTDYQASAMQLLVGGLLGVLGHPLGVRQGNNPTCQSARGISMWSRHAPGKLINLLIDAATANNIAFRFEGQHIKSATESQGLIRTFDYQLDPVSVVLVPHLDKVYNKMMALAQVKYPGKDPHVIVNPAFYGHWIQTGFRSVYNALTGVIDRYDAFVRIFYASFHPEYNGGHHIIYPVPLGIFITDSHANMLGFHAISLLRVDRDEKGIWRAYFYNPNSEGKQNWGQGIQPSVRDYGEEPGESSLPFYQFAARVYAFHYNTIRLEDKAEQVDGKLVQKVHQLARSSWGRAYNWITPAEQNLTS